MTQTRKSNEIEEHEMTSFDRELAQAILSALEYRGFYDCGKYLDASLIEYIRPILDAERAKAIKDTEKAFGGCKKCYGKGYSTVIDFTTSHADFIGDKTYSKPNNPMRFCSCDRGNQLKSLLTPSTSRHQ
jgi:hypothetical protein